MKTLNKILTAFLCFAFPARFIFWILNSLGHKVNSRAKIGFSFIWLNQRLELEKDSKIGHFNFIKIDSISIGKSGYIGKFNNLNGPFNIVLAETAAIGNGNSIYRAPLGVTYDKAELRLGILSKITANHRLDLTRSIKIGDYSTIAGHETQIWTHAYYHDKSGPGRFRLDGEIEIGNNVYIGSRCIINMGLKIGDTVVVGANACISKSLLEPGTYVNQPIRMISTPDGDARTRFKKMDRHDVCEEVYEKK